MLSIITALLHSCEPVAVTYRAGLRHVETEIGQWRAETEARKPSARDQKPQNCETRARSLPESPAVPVDTFRCSLFAPEFPPNGPTRNRRGPPKRPQIG